MDPDKVTPPLAAFIDFVLSRSQWAARIETKIDQIGATMTTVAEALQAWTDYSQGLKDQLAQAEAALTDAQATIQNLRDTDAAEDAAQAAALQDTIATQISDALAAVQNPPEPPVDATPPEDAASVDTGTDTGSVDTGAEAPTDTTEAPPVDLAAPPA